MSNAVIDLDFSKYKRKMLQEHLPRHIEGEVRFDGGSCQLYSTDASIYQITPLGVVIPKTTEDLRVIVQMTTEMRIPIVPRGGGTSLSGQSIGAGIVIDCSKYLNKIIDIDPVLQTALVQPGVVLDQLNRAGNAHGLQFGPDVATATRANLGGMIGNNSAGAHSILHGKTIDHVRRLRVLLHNGKATDFGPLTLEQWFDREMFSSVDGKLFRSVRQVVTETEQDIRGRYPKILRRVSGYNLDAFVDRFVPQGNLQQKKFGLHQLIVGSEGTLGVIQEAELRMVSRPRHIGLLIPHFATLSAAVNAVLICLEHYPAAIELLDRMLIDLARGNLELQRTMSAIQGRPAALLMVEMYGDSELEVRHKIDSLKRRLQSASGVTAVVEAVNADQRVPLWNLRSASMPLLLGMAGDRKPVTFVEDTAVAPEHLPEFVARFQEILRRHGTHGCFYGHASVGCLHIRPVLNLKDLADILRMRQITEDVTDLVLSFNGSLSGEHGDGLARSEWNRKMFGEKVYHAFSRVKEAFDPHNLFNPGKIVNGPPMTENLRYGHQYRNTEPVTLFDYSKQEGFARSIELCNGSGVCRRLDDGKMCPSYRATRDEKDSTRGRANALRLALTNRHAVRELRGKWIHEVLDLCLMCKACKSECPSNVDMSRLKAEVLNIHYQGRLRPIAHWVLSYLPQLLSLSSKIPDLINRLNQNPYMRWVLEKVGGIDRRRSLPKLAGQNFRSWFSQHNPAQSAGKHGKVVLLDDCFTTFQEPAIGIAAVHVLEAAGYSVELAGITCCGRPKLSKGMLPEVRNLIIKQIARLVRFAQQDTPILGLEPSCLLSLVDEWPDLVPGDATGLVAKHSFLADVWLGERLAAGQCQLPLRPAEKACAIHGHCHQQALLGSKGTVNALKTIPQNDVTLMPTGCCGMAGAFGYETEHFDISMEVARSELLPHLQKNEDAIWAASGTSCRHQIHDLTGRHALHPMQILFSQLETNEAETEKVSHTCGDRE